MAKAVCTMDLGILSIHPPLRKGPFALEVDVLLVSLNTKFLTRKKKVPKKKKKKLLILQKKKWVIYFLFF